MIHELKTVPQAFERLLDGSKTFELRRDDRGYQQGDVLILREWTPVDPRTSYEGEFSGRQLRYKVGFVFKQGFGVDLGSYVVMSLLPDDEWQTAQLERLAAEATA